MMASTVILHEDLVLIVTVHGKDNKSFPFLCEAAMVFLRLKRANTYSDASQLMIT